jgi:hypothetical protein
MNENWDDLVMVATNVLVHAEEQDDGTLAWAMMILDVDVNGPDEGCEDPR